jgi:hypothetical protein
VTLHIAIIAIGVLVFVVPAALSRIRRPSAERRRELDVERQRVARQRRRLAAERGLLAAELAAGPARRPGCPWCGFPIPPRG